ncbi:MAG: S8/S53 family peptidase [Planctomycetes bacterium]|nr:S8/S53 family peptidase [Planctomycetota bacterium]
MQPDPYPSAKGLGHGTQGALAVALAAPEADLTLIRIDPAAPYQLQEVARYINGEPYHSSSSTYRYNELTADAKTLDQRRETLRGQHQEIVNTFEDTPEAQKRRAQYFADEVKLRDDQQAYEGRLERYVRLEDALKKLKGIRIVSNSLVWNEGYPLGGSSPLSQYFDRRSFGAALWFQSAGNTEGQAWSALFRDEDGNGAMEFAPASTPLRPGKWSREINFLGWQPFGQEKTPDLPAKARIRLSMQWREAHDPSFFQQGRDLYRQPLANLHLLVLRQRDPAGKTLPADFLDVVGRFEGLPERLDNQPNSATYEETVEFLADPGGRYAIQVVGQVPAGIRPPSVPSLPILQKGWELYPRIFVEAVDPASRQAGRPIFLDYATHLGGLGVPADSVGMITVGAAMPTGKPEPYSTSGPAVGLELLVKPDVLMYDTLQVGGGQTAGAYGTGLATPFTAGLVGSALSAGMGRAEVVQTIHDQEGKVFQVPRKLHP